ncbi:hypothetical protein BXP70_10585 [Hymenobacter crusticola]|uniref:DUF1343 domain-containing protein n=1 Tax=Hymenobacter crusticola TaxID=1770526 RepID=A0A243WF56_9BACT|nr:hypothetical protein BXP70_10585 [Hymenobacter crusticola]
MPQTARLATTSTSVPKPSLQTGAEQLERYLPQLKGRRAGLVVNQTSRLGRSHLVDTLLTQGIQVKTIFAPEHGFRGDADAGATIHDGLDARTKLPVLSLYGANKKPSKEQLAAVDIVVFDIQDVGTRFYTYISTLHYVMEACAENRKPLLVLDRPNPNGWYVDGPIREAGLESFVGLDPLPIVHGLTVGELARMINGEKWLPNGAQCPLTVIPMQGYTHATRYSLPVRPSPNLPNDRAIALYPSLCLFEGTDVSVGRGTDTPFQLLGSPTQPSTRPYRFTPQPTAGAAKPMHVNVPCYGQDLTKPQAGEKPGFTLAYVLNYYQQSTAKDKFFNNFFERLAGTKALRGQIEAGKSEQEIRQSWEPGLSQFKQARKKYLLYTDF